jgi:transposase
MARPISDDLRERVCQAMAEGLSGRQAAIRFKVSAASVSRWAVRRRETGRVSADVMGGDHRSARIEQYADVILRRRAEQPDTTLQEYRALLRDCGDSFGLGSIWRFFQRRRITLKKRRRTPPNSTAPT